MEQPPSSSSVEPPSAEDRLFSALAYPYWYVAFPVYMLSARQQKSEYLRYHMFQGLVLGLALFWGGVSLWTLGAVIGLMIFENMQDEDDEKPKNTPGDEDIV